MHHSTCAVRTNMLVPAVGLLFACICSLPPCAHSIKPPIIREIVPDLTNSLANEFSHRGIETVLALDCHADCAEKIKRLSSNGLSSSCICNAKDVRQWRRILGPRKNSARGVGVVMFQADFQYVPLLTYLSHKFFIKAVAVYGHTGRGAHVALSSAPDATFDKVLFKSEAIHREEFSRVYRDKAWGVEGGGSGPESNLQQTATVRAALVSLLTRYNITSMLDSSCGGMTWMPLVLNNITARLSLPGHRRG